ncbi:hypothetical protein L873DRAFT_1719887, partial [Choiromyces venosus 120613-1]
ASAATCYFLRWVNSAGFTSYTGTMRIPTLPRAGTYYLWPGLQPTDNSGVFQPVLDGRSGTWWIWCGWCCSNPSLPWCGGFNVYAGDSVQFSMAKNGNVWQTSLQRNGGTVVTGSFDLGAKTMNQAIMAIELTGVSWDFGLLQFDNVAIVCPPSNTTDMYDSANAPENYNSATNYVRNVVSVSVSGSTGNCRFTSVILQSPA